MHKNGTNPTLSPGMDDIQRRAESMYVPKRVNKHATVTDANAYKNNDSGYLQAPTVTKNGKMKEYHLSLSQKKPIRTIDRDVSKDKLPKKKTKKGKNKSNSPKERDEKSRDDMPYNGEGPINLEIGDTTEMKRNDHSQNARKASKSGLDKDSSRFIGVNIQK